MTRFLPPWRSKRFAIGFLLSVAAVFWLGRHAGEALVVTKDVGAPDAIVMLASHEWERLPAAAELARRFPSSVVLLTIPVKATKFNCHLCAERPQWLQREGIPVGRIVELAPNPSSNTYGEALATRAYAAGHPLNTIVVVTSPYHTRRALRVFEHVLRGTGTRVGVVPALAYSPANPRRWWTNAYDRAYVRYEWAALIYYRIKFGVALS